ncbi:MAG: HNH endonuclease signature motif containing protein [Gaiellaceae bacterium]
MWIYGLCGQWNTNASSQKRVRRDAAGCWVWIGCTHPKGYGHFWSGGRVGGAHRWAYEYFVGPIPEGLTIDHLCRNRRCVNPVHLEAVSNRENIRREEAGANLRRESPDQLAPPTHCKRGHPLSGNNLYVRPNGSRHCRACARERTRAYARTTKGREAATRRERARQQRA